MATIIIIIIKQSITLIEIWPLHTVVLRVRRPRHRCLLPVLAVLPLLLDPAASATATGARELGSRRAKCGQLSH